MLIIGAFPCW